ncbi:hypothetical protein [Mycobacteroides abscessus]|uniref:Uncharacterized protein n=1 Tax=Mycobacteroides abscessus subsp. massiliense TaxID=1962118 RepID=A0A1T6QGA1_9MYCO|nr:hypothetical protein [Mycobacteroides abscessus]AMU66347.1 hypothetical protein A3O04_14500 [Mycobacteroides abscessus]ANO13430.1 hypothetical protein BAB77_05795 [Mycobacteroides abscessus]ARQ65174.1 hypothetical protein CAK77_14510 [Mycobacteroides abscessus subsp. massiliense]EHM18328.1 hypothetical protein MMAS_27870 [Mycobacteroides abscessus subsp. massiliense CCUG 48898 = JCM 15300]EIV64016.1 hypothetical protein MMCCUG48898_2925 [Mycobacteroides abscessus subsp. massiliense CCUG 488
MNSARNDVLMDGLEDWVHFYRVHRLVYLANPDASPAELQTESLNTVADLVAAGLYQVGTVERGIGFVPWGIPIDEALDRIRAEYVGHYDENGVWDYVAWLNLTDEGQKVAKALLPTS